VSVKDVDIEDECVTDVVRLKEGQMLQDRVRETEVECLTDEVWESVHVDNE
jgi:hypothetical protein